MLVSDILVNIKYTKIETVNRSKNSRYKNPNIYYNNRNATHSIEHYFCSFTVNSSTNSNFDNRNKIGFYFFTLKYTPMFTIIQIADRKFMLQVYSMRTKNDLLFNTLL